MFGYCRPAEEDLLVRDAMYYRAVYCGLCRAMAKRYSPLFALSLRYDYVLLALFRMRLTGERAEIKNRRCLPHPFRRHPAAEPSDAVCAAADGAALLTYYALLDTVRDERGGKRFAARLLLPFARRMRRRACRTERNAALDAEIARRLADLAVRESGPEADAAGNPGGPDEAAEPFGQLLGAVFAADAETDAARRIAFAFGRSVGRFVYLADAADDARDDEKSGSFNPFVRAARAEGLTAAGWMEKYGADAAAAMRLECAGAALALGLTDGTPCDAECARILDNMLTLGLPRTAETVTAPEKSPEKNTDKETEK